jgi:hypothetical protein
MFKKKIENFTCDHCGFDVTGNGYTNHCPKCFYSKHVDIDPGDRKENCHGKMSPISCVVKKGKWVVRQKCISCGKEKDNQTNNEDDIQNLLKIIKEINDKKFYN